MSTLSDEEDDQFFSKLELDEFEVLEEKGTDKRKTVSDKCGGGGFQDDDDDDEVCFLGSFVKDDSKPSTPSTPAPSKKVPFSKSVKVSSSPRGTLKEQRSKRVDRTSNVFENGVDDWNSFVSWFDKQQSFNTPWFQSIPITALNASQCKSVLRTCKDWGHLVQFANMLVSFLDGSTEDCGGDSDVIQLIEVLFERLERELLDNNGCSVLGTQQKKEEFNSVFEEISQRYVAGKINLSSSSIPDMLVRLYPKALEHIMCKVMKTGRVDLLVPVCSKSPPNFLKIMECIHSGEAGLILEDDPDFQNYTDPTHKLASNLLDSLKQSFGSGYLRILPSRLQPIFSFDSVVCRRLDSLSNNETIIDELYSLLNDLFCDCAAGCDYKSDDFLRFMLKLLPFTSRILSDKNTVKNVKFKKYPYLWISIKKSYHFE